MSDQITLVLDYEDADYLVGLLYKAPGGHQHIIDMIMDQMAEIDDDILLDALRQNCPFYQSEYNNNPGLIGDHGPNTCNAGCWSEPVCVTG